MTTYTACTSYCHPTEFDDAANTAAVKFLDDAFVFKCRYGGTFTLVACEAMAPFGFPATPTPVEQTPHKMLDLLPASPIHVAALTSLR